MNIREKGNALMYVLIGVALFAALSYTLSRNTQTGNTSLNNEQIELLASQLINHAQQTQQVVEQMLMTGSVIADLDFIKPGETGFDTAPHQHKVFHPSGGGMNVFNAENENLYYTPTTKSQAWAGWKAQTATNVEWTATAADDVIYSFLGINLDVCAKINELLTGDDTVPLVPVGPRNHFEEDSGSNSDLTVAKCPQCDGFYSMCLQNNASGNVPTFYNILASE